MQHTPHDRSKIISNADNEASFDGMNDALSLFNAGTAALRSGAITTATQLLRTALQRPGKPEIIAAASRNLGIALRRAGEDHAAAESFLNALSIDQHDVDSRYNLGNTLVALGEHKAAIATFQDVRQARPDWAQPANNEGAAWMALGDAQQAETCFSEAVRIEPTFAHAWGNLGAARAALGRHASPLHTLQQALALSPEDPGIRTQLGHLLTELGHFESAIRMFETVLERTPDAPDARAGLSFALHRSGDTIAALARIAPAIASENTHPDEAVAYARICLHMNEPERAIAVLESSLDSAEHPATRVLLGKQLGQVLDAVGQSSRAFQAIDTANQTRALTFDIDAHNRTVDRIIETQQHPFTQSSVIDPTPVFIVGIPRSGTTLLEQMLDAHPDIHGAGERGELQMLSEKMNDGNLSTDTLDRFAQAYLERLRPLAPQAKRITDKMPNNFLHLGHAARLFPAARVIHCVRDPADTGLSCLFQNFKDTLPWATDIHHIAAFMRDHNRLMDHWTEHCPLRMLTVPYEALVANPREWANRILRFLELEPHEAVLKPHMNPRVVRTASHDQVRQPIHTRSVGRFHDYQEHLEPLLELRPSVHAE
jgi:tetratricopeptide (TPR) repeat protein